jgi:hypothetical protein
MRAFAGEDVFRARSLTRSMLGIALPLSLSSGVRYGVELSNAYWIGKLGVGALSIVTALGTFLSLSNENTSRNGILRTLAVRTAARRGITAVAISVTYLFRMAEHKSVRNILHWRVVSYARLGGGVMAL